MTFTQLAFEQPADVLKIVSIFAIVIGALCVVAVIFRTVRLLRNKKTEKSQSGSDAQATNGGASTAETISMRNDYLVIPRNVMLTIGADGEIAAGEYTMMAADGQDSFNLRLNGLVREFTNGDVVTLTAGDTICPVSGAVMIKPVDVQQG